MTRTRVDRTTDDTTGPIRSSTAQHGNCQHETVVVGWQRDLDVPTMRGEASGRWDVRNEAQM